ncbi:MAG TPA: hypothetical protein PLQ63_13385 [Propionicimonas sp.]|nr:hypothetical protein [Propionicimonas sp.]
MDTPELAALIPGLMARHPAHGWTLTSGRIPGEDLVVTLSPVASPERTATVRVFAGAEVFFFEFAGHDSVDFAYDDEERPEALQERIDLAAAATLGPTRVTLDRAGDSVVRSTLVIDPDGPSPRENYGGTWPLRRLKARLRGRRIIRQVIDLPAIGSK